MCACYAIVGMTHDTLRWKLFPFSLTGEAKQWYTYNMGTVNGRWSELISKFCHRLFSARCVVALRREIFSFQQSEKESIGEAWDQLTRLVKSGPALSIPDHVLLEHFYMGLDKESTVYLDIASEDRSPRKL